MKLILGNTTISVRNPRVRIRRHKDLIELNGHKIYPYYSHGGPRMWPNYGVCLKCGHSFLGGADAVFNAVKCGDFD